MSFGRFPGLDDDPFFSHSMPAFPEFPSFPMLGHSHHRHLHGSHGSHGQSHRRSDQQVGLRDPFSIFNDMSRMMNESRLQGNGSGQYFSSSSVMHYSNLDGKEPQMYHATSSVTSGPEGVKETRKTECDSRSGMKKMAVGHHIGERSHTVERRENVRTKDREQHQHLVNLEENEAGSFDREWQNKVSSFRHQPGLQANAEFHANRRGLGAAPAPLSSLHAASKPYDRPERRRQQQKKRHQSEPDIGSSHLHLQGHGSHLGDKDAERERYLKQRCSHPDKKAKF